MLKVSTEKESISFLLLFLFIYVGSKHNGLHSKMRCDTHAHMCETCTIVRFRACLSPPCSHSWLVLSAHQPPQTLMCSICHVWPTGVNLHYINFYKKGITHTVPYFEGSDFSKIVSKCILVLSCIHIVAYFVIIVE